MSRIIICVETQDGSRAKDLDVPANMTGSELARHLAQAIGWYKPEYQYNLKVKLPRNKPLGPDQSLAEASLWDGTHLVLRRELNPHYSPIKPETDMSGRPELAQLVSDRSDKTYPINMGETIIGRSTARTPPSEHRKLIDLTNEPDSDTVSRKHARLLFKDGNWYLQVHPNTHNRTFCGEKQIEAGEKHQLQHNDVLKFGRVILRFKQINRIEG